VPIFTRRRNPTADFPTDAYPAFTWNFNQLYVSKDDRVHFDTFRASTSVATFTRLGRMLKTSIGLCLTMGIAAASNAPNSRHFSSACRAADTVTAVEIISLQRLMHSTSNVDSAFLTNVQLPHVADTSIVVVRDSTVCATAIAAHNSAAGYTSTELGNPSAKSVYLIRVGSEYISFNPAFPSGEFVLHIVWNGSFTRLSTWL
jgi:hypothetical protein